MLSVAPFKIIKWSFNTHLVASVCLFALSRFGKKKDDKSKDAAKASKSKLEALSEEEQPERGR